jgi:outer membrane protein insertion porin family
MKKIITLVFLLAQLSVAAWADTFVIHRIQFQGLQRVAPATVQSYLPVKPGDVLSSSKTAAIVKDLYKTGFFDKIALDRDGNTLIIQVVERPTIGQLTIKGNSIIPTDKLTEVMKTLDIAEGRVYNAAMLEKIKTSLLGQYYLLGRYNARVDITTAPMSRNRLQVTITVSEGLVAKVKRITIIGNTVFDESTLVKQLDLNTSGILTFVTQSDRYSDEKMESSLDKLRAYYMDRGYLRFEVKSSQAQISPDRKSVDVTFIVSEGAPYTVKSVELTGQLYYSHAKLMSLINIQPGEVFSRQKVLDAEKAITKLYGDDGYIFTNVSIRPQVNDSTHQVVILLNVNPAHRTYVRYITFSDNNRTNDEVLRREMQQLESAPVSSAKLDDSKQRLSLLPFVRNVNMSVKPVPNKSNQVDVNYKIEEDNSAQASFKVGYSQVYRMILGAGLNQKNFFGTGNTLGINFQHSQFEQYYGIDYTNPYYTQDGISRSFSLSMSKVDPSAAANVNSGYTTNEYDAGVLYGIPVGQEEGVINRIMAGAGYQNTLINLVNGKVSAQVNRFTIEQGRRFQELVLKLGYSRDSRDRAIFPTSGGLQTFFVNGYAPITNDSLSFYTLDYHGKWFAPINDSFILTARGDLGYGNGVHGVQDYPFFKNYYAGGIDSVRGYSGYTLGPQDSNGLAMGGNMLADASVGLIFPNGLSDNLRTIFFVDAGNVYTDLNNRGFGGQSTNSGPIRYSTGVEAEMITPIGPVDISLAQPLNRQHHDSRDTFQFALGANF